MLSQASHKQNGQSATDDLMADVLTFFAHLLGWVAVVWGAQQIERPFGYLAGIATLLASVASAHTNRMRDALLATVIGVLALIANAIIVVVI